MYDKKIAFLAFSVKRPTIPRLSKSNKRYHKSNHNKKQPRHIVNALYYKRRTQKQPYLSYETSQDEVATKWDGY
jgi:hypothetical protein